MAAVILLDTHLLVWLYEDPEKLVPMAVRRRLDQELLALSPLVRLELQYLYEVERISVPSQVIVAVATATPLVTKDRTIRRHLPLAWWPTAG